MARTAMNVPLIHTAAVIVTVVASEASSVAVPEAW